MEHFTMETGGHYITMLPADWSISTSHDPLPSNYHSDKMLWNPSILLLATRSALGLHLWPAPAKKWFLILSIPQTLNLWRLSCWLSPPSCHPWLQGMKHMLLYCMVSTSLVPTWPGNEAGYLHDVWHHLWPQWCNFWGYSLCTQHQKIRNVISYLCTVIEGYIVSFPNSLSGIGLWERDQWIQLVRRSC